MANWINRNPARRESPIPRVAVDTATTVAGATCDPGGDRSVVVEPFGPGFPAQHRRIFEPLRGSAPRWRTRWLTLMHRGFATATSNRRTSCSTLAELSGSPISGWRKPENSEGDGLTHTGDIVGTLRYMAPERFNGWADAGSDNYALGITLYEMLTLRPAFVESDRLKLIDRISNGAVRTPRSIDARIPNDLETIVLKAMARETCERYVSARCWPRSRTVPGRPFNPCTTQLGASGLAVVPPQSRPCGTHLAGRDADDACRNRFNCGRAGLDPAA